MKTYKNLITEFGNPFSSFRKTYKGIERMYPGVTQFLSVANRWVIKWKLFKNKDLKKVLRRLRRKTDISDMSRRDLKLIHKFIEKYELYDLESIRVVFDDYSDFTNRLQSNTSEEEPQPENIDVV